jgi:hypothetical protein
MHDNQATDYGTSILGFMTAALADGQVLLTLLGLLIGFGGLACAASREFREWADRSAARTDRAREQGRADNRDDRAGRRADRADRDESREDRP